MNPADISQATCTDLPQKWGKRGDSMHYLFKPVPVLQFCHLPKRKRRSMWVDDNKVTEGMLSTVKKLMFEGT